MTEILLILAYCINKIKFMRKSSEIIRTKMFQKYFFRIKNGYAII